MEFRTIYSNPDDFPGAEPVVDCSNDEVLTKQEYAEESDINHIMRRYTEYGVVPPSAVGAASYGDFSDVGDFLESQERVRRAQEDFFELPSKIRDRFNNDPAQLLEFLQNAANRDEAVSLGLIPKPPEIAAVPGAVGVPPPNEATPNVPVVPVAAK